MSSQRQNPQSQSPCVHSSDKNPPPLALGDMLTEREGTAELLGVVVLKTIEELVVTLVVTLAVILTEELPELLGVVDGRELNDWLGD